MQNQFITHKSTGVLGQFDSGSVLEDIQVNLQMNSLQSIITGLNKAKFLAPLDRTLLTYHLDPFFASIKTFS